MQRGGASSGATRSLAVAVTSCPMWMPALEQHSRQVLKQLNAGRISWGAPTPLCEGTIDDAHLQATLCQSRSVWWLQTAGSVKVSVFK